MYDLITIVLGIAAMFVVVGGLAYFLQNRARRRGNLFTQPASRSSRITAFVLGPVFAGMFYLEISYADGFHVVMPVLAILLIAYSLGFNRLIEYLQRMDE